MRLALALTLLATPVQAWEFRATPVCRLSHAAPHVAVTVTFDPRLPEPYAIAITRPEPWPESPTFAIRYEGARPLTIGTDRHVLSRGALTLTVTDTGFGNVLDGLEFGALATAQAGEIAVPFDLSGAAPAVRAFRACVAAPVA